MQATLPSLSDPNPYAYYGSELPSVDPLGGPPAYAQPQADCAWCQYGKPAAVGALIGAGLGLVTGSGVLLGGVAGAAGGVVVGAIRG